MNSWHNIHVWTYHTHPISMLPFFVFLKTLDTPSRNDYKELFNKFVEKFEIPEKVYRTNEFSEWMQMQHTHYYECSH